MTEQLRGNEEWVDGFLFVGNRLILDFLNTKPVLAHGPTEFLADAHALERWLIAAGVVTLPRHKALLRSWRNAAGTTTFLRQLIEFRERLRAAILRIEKGLLPASSLVAEVNALAEQYPMHTLLREQNSKLVRDTTFDLRKPEDLWAPIVDAAADLLSEAEMSRVRQCESCVVHFLDTSRKGSRRWCSMNICGNRLKVAAYQRRQRSVGVVRD
ncbi:MAG TPA: CGNR zinc finger domain-containing protein [Acidobacteriaceae bacterium]